MPLYGIFYLSWEGGGGEGGGRGGRGRGGEKMVVLCKILFVHCEMTLKVCVCVCLYVFACDSAPMWCDALDN